MKQYITRLHHCVVYIHLETPRTRHRTGHTLLQQHLLQTAVHKTAAVHTTYHHNCWERTEEKSFNNYGWDKTDFLLHHDAWPFKDAGPVDSSQMSLRWLTIQDPTPCNGRHHLHITSYEIQLSLTYRVGAKPCRNMAKQEQNCTVVTMMVIQLKDYAFCEKLCLHVSENPVICRVNILMSSIMSLFALIQFQLVWLVSWQEIYDWLYFYNLFLPKTQKLYLA